MTKETDNLEAAIESVRQKQQVADKPKAVGGYSVALTILTDLFGCILIGFAVGVFLQKFFHTSALLTAGLTLAGGIAGLYTVARYALKQEKQ